MMNPLYFLVAGLVVAFAGMVQSTVGFGFALVATPLLIWTGMPLPDIIAMVVTCALLQSALGAAQLRAEIPWRLVLHSSWMRIVTLAVGLHLLRGLIEVDPRWVRVLVGFLVCLLVGVQVIWRPVPRPRLHGGWAALAFSASGLLAGFTGMGGPPLVLWAMAHDWSSRKTRGFLFACFSFSIPVQLLFMQFTFGHSVLLHAGIGLLLMPFLYAGMALGMPLGNRMKKERLRWIAFVVLFVIGLSAALPALCTLLHNA